MSTWVDPWETTGKVERRNPVAVRKDALLEMRRGLLTLCSTFQGHLTREHILDIESAREAGREPVCFSPEACVEVAVWETDGHGSCRLENANPRQSMVPPRQAGREQESHSHSFPWTATERL